MTFVARLARQKNVEVVCSLHCMEEHHLEVEFIHALILWRCSAWNNAIADGGEHDAVTEAVGLGRVFGVIGRDALFEPKRVIVLHFHHVDNVDAYDVGTKRDFGEKDCTYRIFKAALFQFIGVRFDMGREPWSLVQQKPLIVEMQKNFGKDQGYVGCKGPRWRYR